MNYPWCGRWCRGSLARLYVRRHQSEASRVHRSTPSSCLPCWDTPWTRVDLPCKSRRCRPRLVRPASSLLRGIPCRHFRLETCAEVRWYAALQHEVKMRCSLLNIIILDFEIDVYLNFRSCRTSRALRCRDWGSSRGCPCSQEPLQWSSTYSDPDPGPCARSWRRGRSQSSNQTARCPCMKRYFSCFRCK